MEAKWPGVMRAAVVPCLLVTPAIFLPVFSIVLFHGFHNRLCFCQVRKRQPRNLYDETISILGDEILGEIFLSVLLQCSRLQFKLHLYNASFLDETWFLPHYLKLEFVPCKVLGICAWYVCISILVWVCSSFELDIFVAYS